MVRNKNNGNQANETPKKSVSLKQVIAVTILVSFFTSAFVGGAIGLTAGIFAREFFAPSIKKALHIDSKSSAPTDKTSTQVNVVKEESAIIAAVKKVAPTTVSIVVTRDLEKLKDFHNFPFKDDPFFKEFFKDFPHFFEEPENENKNEKKEIGGGTGFIISSDGLILTNRHVVEDTEAEYTVLTNDGKKYDAKVLARDPANDIALIKIKAKNLPVAELGDSSNLQIGQTVIAIGNALGEYRNTVSTGVVSGLSRSITASDGFSTRQRLKGVIQTDAAINFGNSGGPLVNIKGQVIGINTAIAYGAENIGFAIPINDAKEDIKSVKAHGKIIRPMLGVRYTIINKVVQEKNNLSVDYGALVIRGEKPEEVAVIPGGPADKAGIVENDIILEVDGVKVTEENTLSDLILKHKVGDEVELKLLHKGKEKKVKVKLAERTE